MTEQLPYGVTIKQASGASVWRVTECRHLPPAENRGGQNVFVKAFDQYGVRVHGLRVVYQRGNGQPLEYVPLDKPDNPAMEKGHGNIPIYPNDTITLGILGSTCDIVSGIHTRHPDELGPDGETWNSRGHHSWIVAFQRGAGSVVEPEPEKPTGPPPDPDRLAALEATVAALTLRVVDLETLIFNQQGEL